MGESEQHSKPADALGAEDAPFKNFVIDEGHAVDIRRPKPWHGFREFLKEYGIIVLGVLTALGAEQVVEIIHRNMEIEHARAALRIELDHDLGVVAYRQAQQTCINRRMDDVDGWLASFRSGHPIALTDAIGGPSSYSIHSSVWEIVKAGQAAAYMSLADKIAYAEIYDVFQNISTLQDDERDAWRILRDTDGARALDEAEQRRVSNAVKLIRRRSALYDANLDEIASSVSRLGLKPDRLADYYPEQNQRLCMSIRPKT